MVVKTRFTLNPETKTQLQNMQPSFGFNGFSEFVYYRTYSRRRPDGTQERWADTVIRVVEGVMSIRKDHHHRSRLKWNDEHYQNFATKMAISLFSMEWLPPGRGLWAMGTDYVYERGSAALYNCAAVSTAGDLAHAAEWVMDMLMNGVGVGFDTFWTGKITLPDFDHPEPYTIPDSREGWVESVRRLLRAYTHGERFPTFDYDSIRPAGAPIKGFGGTSAGVGPLKELHYRIMGYMERYHRGETDSVRLVADIMNAIGATVVAGNVRRSAQIALGSVHDETFCNLKNYGKHPERQEIGWLSNNSVVLREHEDFEALPNIAERIVENGEPGLINLINVQRYGRFGRDSRDAASLINPCGEIPLESFETCNLSEVFPTRCGTKERFEEVLSFATFYSSTVTLLPTHRDETNEIILRNRRIGVSLSGVAQLLEKLGAAQTTRWLRDGYKQVLAANEHYAKLAGIPASLRLTTIKPSGTISQLVGVPSGMHYPTFRHALRRVRVGTHMPIFRFLEEAGVPHEPDLYSKNTAVFTWPIKIDCHREARQVSAWEQFATLAMLQREWSDNAVSATVYFDPEKEASQVEHMLAQFAPVIKSASMLPHTNGGAYAQMPYEGITEEEYHHAAQLPSLDWNRFAGQEGVGERYCNNDTCEVSTNA